MSDNGRENDSVFTYLRAEREARLESQVNVRGTNYVRGIQSQTSEPAVIRELTNSTETASNEDSPSNRRFSHSFARRKRQGQTSVSIGESLPFHSDREGRALSCNVRVRRLGSP